MSSETDHPRQRTVAELLAAHGDGNVSGRRRRRREPDEPDEPDDGAYGAPAADPPDWRSAPPGEPERPAPGTGLPPAPREPAGRRRDGDEPPWASNQWGSDQWEADEWEDADPWDAGRREAPRRAAPEPAQPSWEESWEGRSRTPRYPEQEPVEPPEATPRRGRRREPDEWEPAAEAWDAREPSRSPDALVEEPRRSREREAPARPSRAAEPNGRPVRPAEPNGRPVRPAEPNGRPVRPAEPNGRPARVAEPDGRVPRVREPRSWDAPEPMPGPVAADSLAEPTPADRMPDRPTEQMPRVRATSAPDPAATTRMQQRRRAQPEPEIDEADLDDDGGPATMVGGAPAGAEAWHRARTADRRRDADGGPPTQAAAPMNFDDDDEDDVPPAPARDYPAGLGGHGPADEAGSFFDAEAEPEEPAQGRAPKGRPAKGRPAKGKPATEDSDEPAAAPSWPAVIAQWIAGAIGGAALWVGFRFLWRDFPVVALAAAVLVTVGLVVVVRALLRSNDLRTTLFAVLVGLLLTLSPAILVLLGR
jgi:hypothetical protein